MRQKIAIKKLKGIVVDTDGLHNNTQLAATFAASLMPYGYSVTPELFEALKSTSHETLIRLHKEVIENIKLIKGADVKYEALYPNFPEQVMEMETLELFLRALEHYWVGSRWENTKLPREFALENVALTKLRRITQEQYSRIFELLLISQDSLSQEDQEIVKWFIEKESVLIIPDAIPYKETMCIVASLLLKQHRDIHPLVKTATDVLRIITYINGGDISLAENTKFNSMPRAERRKFIKLIENVVNEEDIQRHRNKWVRLFHSLHVGEYSPKLREIANKIRNNQKIETFNSHVEKSIKDLNIESAEKLLAARPSEYARRLDHLLRLSQDCERTTKSFAGVVEKVPTRILAQLLGHLKNRNEERIVFPKGQTQRARIIDRIQTKLPLKINLSLLTNINQTLIERFKKLPDLGTVWIDPELKHCPLPTQQRSASTGAFNVARGTHIPFKDFSKNTLRFFIYWIGQDIDLSATLHDENFNVIEQISYTHLRSTKYQACHSGDITRAPNGASEFIDITINEAAKIARYVVMNVFVFSGPNFSEHEKCYAGWMLRSKPQSNEIYDPKTVEQKINLTCNAKYAVPVVFDLIERKAIWCDLAAKNRTFWGNNVEANRATVEQTLRTIVKVNKYSLYELFQLHAQARGLLVDKKEEANKIYSFTEGITPYDINVINSEYLV